MPEYKRTCDRCGEKSHQTHQGCYGYFTLCRSCKLELEGASRQVEITSENVKVDG